MIRMIGVRTDIMAEMICQYSRKHQRIETKIICGKRVKKEKKFLTIKKPRIGKWRVIIIKLL